MAVSEIFLYKLCNLQKYMYFVFMKSFPLESFEYQSHEGYTVLVIGQKALSEREGHKVSKSGKHINTVIVYLALSQSHVLFQC